MIDNVDIYNYLSFHDIKCSNRGFQYLITAIQFGIEDIKNCKRIDKLYEEVAKIHKTAKANVERTIRYDIAEQSLSNKEFITKAVYDLHMIDKECAAEKNAYRHIQHGMFSESR